MPFTLTLTALLQRNTRLFFLLPFSLLFWQCMRPNFPFSSAASNANLKLGGEEEEAVSERPKTVAAAGRSDEDLQAYISASRHASSVITKDKAEEWQATCSCLSF